MVEEGFDRAAFFLVLFVSTWIFRLGRHDSS
jgi:hypothetical protein